MVHPDYVYLASAVPILCVWVVFYSLRKDLRKGMLIMSLLLGVLSVVTAHYWWTVDWWRPATITGTAVGIEDFILGFATGGCMTFVYEIVFKKRLYGSRKKDPGYSSRYALLFLLAFLTAWLFWGVGLTSFWASFIAMLTTAGVLFFYRRDLIWAGIAGGVLTALISLPFYILILFISPTWVQETYLFETLSGVLIFGIPIEEFIFWFLAGLVFGPFYEYWQGLRVRNMPVNHQKYH